MILYDIILNLFLFSVFYSLLLVVLLKIYMVYKRGWCTNKICLQGKTVIVTGSNTGIGYQASLEFAKRGARIILACRDLKKAAEAKNNIVSFTNNKNVIVKELNLSSIKSIKKFVNDVKENEERLDILVNNAGCGSNKHEYTEDGLQILMQSNYFGPVLLTTLLLDLLQRTKSSRIINVSSSVAQYANLTVENLNMWPGSDFVLYNNSKLANILFTIKLSRLLKGSSVTIYSLHPGAVSTNIWRNFKGWPKIFLSVFSMLYFKTPEEGAQTILYTALEPGVEKYSGDHFEECRRISPYGRVMDPEFVDEIWHKTLKLLHCENELEELFNNY